MFCEFTRTRIAITPAVPDRARASVDLDRRERWGVLLVVLFIEWEFMLELKGALSKPRIIVFATPARKRDQRSPSGLR